MGLEEKKALVYRFVEEVLNQKKLDVIDEVYTEDFSYLAPLAPLELSTKQGLPTIKWAIKVFVEAFPDVKSTIVSCVGEGDMVVVDIFFEGTNTGEFAGFPPTGRKIAGNEIWSNHFAPNGKINRLLIGEYGVSLAAQVRD